MKYSFHGAYKLKRNAIQKARKVSAFVKRVKILGHIRYSVVKKATR